MTDRPILFSAPMVRALIEDRKTQTRRIFKPQPEDAGNGYVRINGHLGSTDFLMREIAPRHWTRIKVGDRLWVRESVTRFDKGTCDQHVWYRAGHNTREFYQMFTADIAGRTDGEWPHDEGPAGGAPYKVPSIHMPRWASRLTLPVSGVKIERLQDISEEDAIAEGCTPTDDGMFIIPGQYLASDAKVPRKAVTAVSAFGSLWRQINGDSSWDDNPWVVAYTVSVIKQNIDDIERAAA